MKVPSKEDMVKFIVQTDGSDWHGMTAEIMWGAVLGDNILRVENYPLYAYNISYHDIVRCRPGSQNLFEFVCVSQKGGHSNYRLLLRRGKSKKDFVKAWVQLENLGCSYESSRDPEDVFAIDVPPDSDIFAVFDILRDGEEDIWHLDEGNVEHNV